MNILDQLLTVPILNHHRINQAAPEERPRKISKKNKFLLLVDESTHLRDLNIFNFKMGIHVGHFESLEKLSNHGLFVKQWKGIQKTAVNQPFFIVA